MRGLCRPSAQLLDEGALGRPGRGVLAPRDLHGQERGERGWHWIAAALPSMRGDSRKNYAAMSILFATV